MTTPSQQRDDPFADLPVPLNGKVAAIIFGLVCAALIWSSFPRLVSSLPAEKSADILARMNHGNVVTLQDIEAAIDAASSAIRFSPRSGELYVRRATLRQRRLALLEVDLAPELEKIRDDAITATKYAPADPYAWYMLAFSDQALNGALSDQAKRALRASILLGRSESVLILPRITMGIHYWNDLTPELETLIHNQINLALRHWHLIKPFGAYIAGLDKAQGDYVMSIIEQTPHVPPDGLRRVKNMARLNIECARDTSYSWECKELDSEVTLGLNKTPL